MKFYVKESLKDNISYSSPGIIYEQFEHLKYADQESFWVIGMNTALRCTLKECIFKGRIDSCNIDFRLMFNHLIKANCTSFFIIHNHPAGTNFASIDDNKLTNKTATIGAFLDIHLLDHIIIGDTGYFNYKSQAPSFLKPGAICANN